VVCSNHPVVAEQGAEERSESLGIGQKLEVPVEAQLAVGEGLLQGIDEVPFPESDIPPAQGPNSRLGPEGKMVGGFPTVSTFPSAKESMPLRAPSAVPVVFYWRREFCFGA
jgi:hypothetical protein